MAVVSVPGHEPWIVGRQLFRPLMQRLAQASDSPEDIYTAEQAQALDGLHFHLLPEPQASRMARRLDAVAAEMRAEALRGDPTDATARAELLAELSLCLFDFLEVPAADGESDAARAAGEHDPP